MSSIHSNDHAKIVANLKKARKESGLDQLQVAKLLKRSQSYISKIESGQRKIDVIDLQKFGQIYKKPLTFFID